MGAGFILFPLALYLVLMGVFCALVGAKTTRRMGWAMSAGLVFLPLALLVGAVSPLGR
ncbi:hypothetical protein AB0C52_29855 [Streptomyces sp. NPDC048717]|uniref:hypothetical protein n=1 Tax=unclassified Streptomyces TaxID=2593676 RepID=UPI0034147A19